MFAKQQKQIYLTQSEEFKMTRSKLEKLITDFVIKHDLDASFVQQTEGLTYVRFVVEEDFQDD